jgi:RNA polymerase sigma-70 factor (ECF subfamily)
VSLLGSYQGIFEEWELRHARAFVRTYQLRFKALRKEGFEDLLQECLAHWFFVRDQYDPEKAVLCKTFMSRVMENKLMDISQATDREKRKILYQSLSLDEVMQDGEGDGLDFLIVEDEELKRFFKSDFEVVLARALKKLSRRQKELCRLVRDEGASLNQARKALNISKGAVYDEVLRIRAVFKEEGLEQYL